MKNTWIMFSICTIGNERIVIPARGSGVPAGGIKKENNTSGTLEPRTTRKF
jgi:hypothetical protein